MLCHFDRGLVTSRFGLACGNQERSGELAARARRHDANARRSCVEVAGDAFWAPACLTCSGDPEWRGRYRRVAACAFVAISSEDGRQRGSVGARPRSVHLGARCVGGLSGRLVAETAVRTAELDSWLPAWLCGMAVGVAAAAQPGVQCGSFRERSWRCGRPQARVEYSHDE